MNDSRTSLEVEFRSNCELSPGGIGGSRLSSRTLMGIRSRGHIDQNLII